MVEEINLEPFVDLFPLITSRRIEITGRAESPDFEGMADGKSFGVELTEIRDHEYTDEYLAEVFRIAAKKSASYSKHGDFNN
jgi:hypothetical protein